MAVDPNIKKKADDIRNKIYGKEVRESLASGLEEMSTDVVETVGRQDEVEGQFQDVIDNTTGKDVISAPEIIAARDGEANLKARLDKEKNEVTAQLAQTKPIKYFNQIPTTSDLNEGELGVLVKDEVKLKITNSYPKISGENVGTHDPIFVDFNMEINKETLDTISVRLFKSTDTSVGVVMLRGFDNVNNRMILFPTPALEPNTNYRLEITDRLQSTKGYTIGTSKKYIIPFTTGEASVISFDDIMQDYELNWTVTTKGSPSITKHNGFTKIQTNPGDEVNLTAMDGTVPTPATVDFLVKPILVRGRQFIHFRIMRLARQYIIRLGGANEQGGAAEVKGYASDLLGDGNELNKEFAVDIRDYVHVRIAYRPDGLINSWFNGFKLPDVANRSLSGSNIQMVITSAGLTAEYDLHHVTVFNELRGFDHGL